MGQFLYLYQMACYQFPVLRFVTWAVLLALAYILVS
jgi:hypothetical protein